MNVVSDRTVMPMRGTDGSAAATEIASIRILESDRATVLTAAGEIDMSNQARFRAELERAASGGRRIVVDLTRATTLSSHAIGVLYRHADRLTAVYVARGSVIARALSFSGFASRVPVIGDPRSGAQSCGCAAI